MVHAAFVLGLGGCGGQERTEPSTVECNGDDGGRGDAGAGPGGGARDGGIAVDASRINSGHDDSGRDGGDQSGRGDGGRDGGDESGRDDGGRDGGDDVGAVPAFVMELPVASESCEETGAPALNLASGGTATASDPGDDGEGSIAKIFDDHSGTKWAVSGNPTPWIAYEFPDANARVVKTYTVTTAGDGDGSSDPESWELQGSNDGPGATDITWTTLDTREGEVFAKRYHTHTYSLDNDVPYHRYRFLVTANGGAPNFQLAELALLDDGSPAFSIDDADDADPDNHFAFSGGWDGHTFDNASERYSGTSSWSATPDEFVTVAWVGSQVHLYGVRDPNHGILGVSVDDGEAMMVDLYGPDTAFNELIFTSAVRCSGPHTLRVDVMGAKNLESTGVYISLDRVKVIP